MSRPLLPYAAYCFANGAIFFGFKVPRGGLLIASGEREQVRRLVTLYSRRDVDGLWVPGVPEAANNEEAIAAFARWIAWCVRRSEPGVEWNFTVVQLE